MQKFNVVVTHAIPQSAAAIAREQHLQKLSGGKALAERKSETRLTLEAGNESDLPTLIALEIFKPQAVVRAVQWQPLHLTRLAEVAAIGRMHAKSRPALPVVKLMPQDWIRHFGRQPRKGEVCYAPVFLFQDTPLDPDTVFLWRLEAAPQIKEVGMFL